MLYSEDAIVQLIEGELEQRKHRADVADELAQELQAAAGEAKAAYKASPTANLESEMRQAEIKVHQAIEQLFFSVEEVNAASAARAFVLAILEIEERGPTIH